MRSTFPSFRAWQYSLGVDHIALDNWALSGRLKSEWNPSKPGDRTTVPNHRVNLHFKRMSYGKCLGQHWAMSN
jgi:hypothetical protein